MLYLFGPVLLLFELLERPSLHERFRLVKDIATAAEVDHARFIPENSMVRVERPLHLDVVPGVEHGHDLQFAREMISGYESPRPARGQGLAVDGGFGGGRYDLQHGVSSAGLFVAAPVRSGLPHARVQPR